jgi:hypothetical protein
LLKHWHKIEHHSVLQVLFPKPPLLAFKRAKNLADILVKSKLPGSFERFKTKESHPRDTHQGVHPPSALLTPIKDTSVLEWTDTDEDHLRCLLDLMNE